jgi:hypothetical protein
VWATSVVPQYRFPFMAEALIDRLEDHEPASPGSSSRRCDAAAEALVRLLDLPAQTFRSGDTVEDRDAAIGEIRRWWSEHRTTIDWARLQARPLWD